MEVIVPVRESFSKGGLQREERLEVIVIEIGSDGDRDWMCQCQ